MHRDFIEGVLRDMQGNAIMAIATGRTPTNKLKIEQMDSFRYPDEIDKMVAYAERNRQGDNRNVYLSPIIYGDKRTEKGKISRDKDNALFAQTIYMDSDSCPPDAFRLPPSRHVQTSETNGHDYWFLPEPIPASEASEIAHRITTAHEPQGCDPSGWSQNKLLRMPTVNTKNDQQNPFKITWHDTGEIYDPADVSGAYDDIILTTKADSTPLKPEQHEMTADELLDFMDLVGTIPASEKRLNDLIYKTPKEGPDGWRSEHRYALLTDLYRYGFDTQQVVSIAWGCPAASKWRADDRGLAGLQAEAEKAKREIDYEKGGDADGEVLEESSPVVIAVEVSLLSPSERKRAEGRWDVLAEYGEWARSRVPVFNKPYHDINSITWLSIAFGDVAFIPKEGGRMPLNIYSMTLGESSSGKTEADDLMWTANNPLYPHDSPDIGGNHSDNALIERLLERQNKVSVVHSDEADGLLAQWKNGGWTTGIQSTHTKIYDGRIPQLGRVDKSNLQVAQARACVVSHMMGTFEGMLEILDTSMFKTGYLARQIWAIGEDIPVTRESIRTRQVVGDVAKFYDSMPKFWANRFNRIKGKLRENLKIGETQVAVLMTNEAMERFEEAKWAMIQQFANSGNPGVFKTAVRRMNDIIWKVSALLALSEGTKYINVDHIVRVLSFTETWLKSLVFVAHGISSSSFSKACDEIERFIASREGKEAEVSAIYALRKSEPIYRTDEYLTSLMKQRRITERPTKAGGPRYYKIREEKK